MQGLSAYAFFSVQDLDPTAVYWPEVLDADSPLSDALCLPQDESSAAALHAKWLPTFVKFYQILKGLFSAVSQPIVAKKEE